MTHILVTGARGFIGSAFIRALVHDDVSVTAFVRDTNDWTKARLDTIACKEACRIGRLRIVKGDLNGDISGLCEKVDIVFNFAARTFVDHSIKDPLPFVKANVLGTANILEEARRQGVGTFFQISTNEVYGQILEGAHHEDSPICPRNPYAASKAGGDALVISYTHTFGMWTCVVRTENNYGPYQNPQKAIPVFISKAQRNENIPVYGDGKHIRQWLHVHDLVDALMKLMHNCLYRRVGPGEIFHVAGNQEVTNTYLAMAILDILGKPQHRIEYIDDFDIRPGHDRRYAMTCEKIFAATGWTQKISLAQGLEEVVHWYKQHPEWLRAV
jgi:dTDP-glucose 4,6-dehydratase